MPRFSALSAAVVASFSLAGCTWQHAYSAGQEWQRNACNRLIEATERERCLSSNSMSYDDYRRRTDAAKKD
jgi:hypothetical protein